MEILKADASLPLLFHIMYFTLQILNPKCFKPLPPKNISKPL